MKKIFLFLTIFLAFMFLPVLVNAEVSPTGFNFCMGSVCTSTTYSSRTNGLNQSVALRVQSNFQFNPDDLSLNTDSQTINAFYVICSSTDELINDTKYADVEVTKLNYQCKFMDGGTGTPYLFHLSDVGHHAMNSTWTYQSGPIFNSLNYHAVWFVMNYYLSLDNIDNNTLIAYMKTMEDGIVWNINSSMNQILDKLNNLSFGDGVIAGINNNTNQKFDELNNNINATGSAINSNIDSMKEKQDETNKQLGDLNNNITNDNVDDASSSANDFFTGFESDDYGLTAIVTAPLNFIKSITSSTCTPLGFPLPFVDKRAELPCMNAIYKEHFGSFLTLYQTITFGIVAYWVCVNTLATIRGFKDPNSDRIEVLDL